MPRHDNKRMTRPTPPTTTPTTRSPTETARRRKINAGGTPRRVFDAQKHLTNPTFGDPERQTLGWCSIV
jgi:hypothetical protein